MKYRTDHAVAPGRRWLAGSAAALLCLYPFAAMAYVGPGAGLGMLGSLVAVVVAVVLAVAGLLILPLRLLKKRLQKNHGADSGAGQDDSPGN